MSKSMSGFSRPVPDPEIMAVCWDGSKSGQTLLSAMANSFSLLNEDQRGPEPSCWEFVCPPGDELMDMGCVVSMYWCGKRMHALIKFNGQVVRVDEGERDEFFEYRIALVIERMIGNDAIKKVYEDLGMSGIWRRSTDGRWMSRW